MFLLPFGSLAGLCAPTAFRKFAGGLSFLDECGPCRPRPGAPGSLSDGSLVWKRSRRSERLEPDLGNG